MHAVVTFNYKFVRYCYDISTPRPRMHARSPPRHRPKDNHLNCLQWNIFLFFATSNDLLYLSFFLSVFVSLFGHSFLSFFGRFFLSFFLSFFLFLFLFLCFVVPFFLSFFLFLFLFLVVPLFLSFFLSLVVPFFLSFFLSFFVFVCLFLSFLSDLILFDQKQKWRSKWQETSVEWTIYVILFFPSFLALRRLYMKISTPWNVFPFQIGIANRVLARPFCFYNVFILSLSSLFCYCCPCIS